MLYETATARHLAFARILVLGVLLVDLLIDPLVTLADMPAEAFLPHGVLRLLPSSAHEFLLREPILVTFQWAYGSVLLLGLLGIGPRGVILIATVVGTIWFHGIGRGFGGHVNHQELIALHALILLACFPCFDALALDHYFRRVNPVVRDEAVYRFSMRTLCFWIAMCYFFIGVARLGTTDFRVYLCNAMEYYAWEHSIKWNYWEFGWARDLQNQPWLQYFLRASFPAATMLEVCVPLALFFRRLSVVLVLSLWVFHLAILLFMNIFFWQWMVLLLLFLGGFHRAPS